MIDLRDCIVLHGSELEPHWCYRFAVKDDTIAAMDLGEPCTAIANGALVVIPGLYNGHTHIGDCCAPDGATGMTLEQGFFRPHGYKYRKLAQQSEAEHLAQISQHLRYMARTGTIGHLDFREQGAYGSQLLRQAAEATGVRSVILGQFDSIPFSEEALQENKAQLSPEAIAELKSILAIADGFSESTINDLTDAAWVEIYQLTTQHNKIRAIHCLENEGYRDVSFAITGQGDVKRAFTHYHPHLVIHATVANADEINLLAQHSANVVLNPRANANLGLPLPPVAALLTSNISLLLGTDNVLLNSPNLFAELDFTYKVAKSQFANAKQPHPKSILKMVTSNVRTVLGGDVYGYLEVGLPADFVVLNFHQPHLRSSQHLLASILTRVTPEDVLMTVRQGTPLWQAKEGLMEQQFLR